MNNTEKLTTSDTQDTRKNKHQSKQKEQHRDTDIIVHTRQNKHQSKQKEKSRMNNTETLTTLDTQDTRKINTRVNRRENQDRTTQRH